MRVDEAAIGQVFRENSGRSVAALIRVFEDIDLAEDAVQEAFGIALRKWPADGYAAQPLARWITTTARKRAIDRLRRESRERELLGQIAASPSAGDEDETDVEARPVQDRPAAPDLHLLPSGAVA